MAPNIPSLALDMAANMLWPGRFSVAPMLDRTDRHCRHFHRLLSRHALLYTEMVTTEAILLRRRDFWSFAEAAPPVAFQLGGSDPKALALCARQAEQHGYVEVNLNVGCPSQKVKRGCFGASLMAHSSLVAECVKAMRDQVTIPVTVKTRLGIDHLESYSFLTDFIETVATKGSCDTFILHARKAWLSGLSPKENRQVPPLNYERVYQVKRDFPHLAIVINGGVQTLTEVQNHLAQVDGVMVGRAAYQHPDLLTEVDWKIFNSHMPMVDPFKAVEAFYPYIKQETSTGRSLSGLLQPLMGLFHSLPGARLWRSSLGGGPHSTEDPVEVVRQALRLVKSQRG